MQKEDCAPRDNDPFQSSVVQKGAGCTFPCRVQWLSASMESRLKHPLSLSYAFQRERTQYEQEECIFLLLMLSAVDFLLARLNCSVL